MFQDLIANLTMEQKRELMARGIPQPRLSDWKRGVRLPTRPQVLLLADVVNVDPLKIEAEVMLLETPPADRARYAKRLGVGTMLAVLAILILGVIAGGDFSNGDAGLAFMLPLFTPYTSWKTS